MNTTYTCGGCTACCTTHGVKAIEKLPQIQCSFCTMGQGCSVYSTRPAECQDFECSWLKGNGGGVQCRPDKTGIVGVHEFIPDAGIVLVLTEYHSDALSSEFVFKWTRIVLFRAGFVIHKPIRGDVLFYLPKGALMPTDPEKCTLEKHFQKKVECISFGSCLHGLVL